ncbi:PilZ domain-containing protein [Desulfobacterales bacterium HSG2]|nr:PilZ domain-containing protein [Desulfobacterales bacterium HSG2]
MGTIEKRRHSRIDSLNLSYVCVNEKGKFVNQGMGRTLNVSESGILLETHFCIEPEQLLALTIALEDELVDIRGKVAHCRETGDAKFKTGIEFLETDEVLKKFIQLFRKSQSVDESE